MYDLIHTMRYETLGYALLATVVTALLLRRGGFWWRGLAISYGHSFAVAFFIVALGSPGVSSAVDLFVCFLFELVVFFVFLHFCFRAYECIEFSESDCARFERDGRRLLLATLCTQLIAAAPLLLSSGFGFFSDGSRIDFLSESPANKYFIYAISYLSFLQAFIVAQHFNAERINWNIIWPILAFNFLFSILAGSKGVFFLWILTMLGLINVAKIRWAWWQWALVASCGGALFLISTHFISEMFGISYGEFIELAIYRVFLINDGRALSIDLVGQYTAGSTFFSEAFRSLAPLFGTSPVYPPLGAMLYEDYFDMPSSSGANASLTSLALAFSDAGRVLETLAPFFLLLGVGLLGFSCWINRIESPMHKAVALSSAIFLLGLFSQDFLAFQVALPIVLVFVLLGLPLICRLRGVSDE